MGGADMYIPAFPKVRTCSSAGEHLVDIEGVTGSIPVASTISPLFLPTGRRPPLSAPTVRALNRAIGPPMPFPASHPALDRALSERGYAVPSPVQSAVLEAEQGRDLLVSAQNGSVPTQWSGKGGGPPEKLSAGRK